jgi:hypothetical protein
MPHQIAASVTKAVTNEDDGLQMISALADHWPAKTLRIT